MPKFEVNFPSVLLFIGLICMLVLAWVLDIREQKNK